MDIKETKELVASLKLLAVAGKRISKNGIGVDDIVELIELAKKTDVLLAGFKGLDIMMAELKDLDQTEVFAVIGELYSLADSVNKA